MSETIEANIATQKALFKVKIGDFDGPLDVLCQLIQFQRVDILAVNLIDLINQYIDFINAKMDEIQINGAIEYLTMAAYLVSVKSKRLIPVDKIDEASWEEERAKILEQIVKYNEYKRLTQIMLKKQEARRKHMDAPAHNLRDAYDFKNIVIEKLPQTIGLNTVAKIMEQIIDSYKYRMLTKKAINAYETPIELVNATFYANIKALKEIHFIDYIDTKIPRDVLTFDYICTLFLVVLDLARMGGVILDPLENDILITFSSEYENNFKDVY